MNRHVLALLALFAAPAVFAQSDLHVFELRDGQVYLDGRLLPGAIPDSLDLRGMSMAMEYSRALTPVLEIDGRPYVLHQNKLVPFDETERSGTAVYVLGQPSPMAVEAMPDEQLARMSEAAYLREVASRDQGLYDKLRREQQLEFQALRLAEEVRAMAAGPERDRSVADLRRQLDVIFRLKQETRREEIARAQDQIDRVKAVLDDRDARRDAIVEERLRELAGGQ